MEEAKDLKYEDLRNATVIEAWEHGFLEGKAVYHGFRFRLVNGREIIVQNDRKGHIVQFVPPPEDAPKDMWVDSKGGIHYSSSYRLKEIRTNLRKLWRLLIVTGPPTVFAWAINESLVPSQDTLQVPLLVFLGTVWASGAILVIKEMESS